MIKYYISITMLTVVVVAAVAGNIFISNNSDEDKLRQKLIENAAQTPIPDYYTAAPFYQTPSPSPYESSLQQGIYLGKLEKGYDVFLKIADTSDGVAVAYKISGATQYQDRNKTPVFLDSFQNGDAIEYSLDANGQLLVVKSQ